VLKKLANQSFTIPFIFLINHSIYNITPYIYLGSFIYLLRRPGISLIMREIIIEGMVDLVRGTSHLSSFTISYNENNIAIT